MGKIMRSEVEEQLSVVIASYNPESKWTLSPFADEVVVFGSEPSPIICRVGLEQIEYIATGSQYINLASDVQAVLIKFKQLLELEDESEYDQDVIDKYLLEK